ncbi:MAG: AraC family transcriptional regulator [Acidobacteriota bacterium]
MDLLADVITNTHTGGILFSLTRLRGPWGFGFTGHRYWGFHMLTEGRCWLLVEGQELAQPMTAGDLVIVGVDHALADHPDDSILPFEPATFQQSAVAGLEAPYDVELVCGAYDFESETAHPIFSSLPPVIYVPAAQRPPAVTTLMALMQQELSLGLPGNRILQERLMDALLVYLLRHWLAHEGAACGGWLGALRHPLLAKAIALLHNAPTDPWTVESLARAVGMSRASLARHFQQEVGSSPMLYLSRWRLENARRLLRQSDLSLDEIAAKIGYATGFSLSKAFKHTFGISPGQFRAMPS